MSKIISGSDKTKEIEYKSKKDYRKNIKIKKVKFSKGLAFDLLIINLVDNNRKHFKNKTLCEEFFYNNENGLKYYVECFVDNYIDDMIGKKIRKAQTDMIIEEYNKQIEKSE